MSLKNEFRSKVLSAGNTQSTFNAYWPHIQSFIAYTRKRRKSDVTRDDVNEEDVFAWRDYLASSLNLAPKSCNQAISAVKFLFVHVIGRPLVETDEKKLRLREPRRQRRRMVSRPDMIRFFEHLRPRDRLIAQLMYAGLMRLSDVIRTRIKDYNFADEQIEIADTKHNHFRILPFPKSLHESTLIQMKTIARLQQSDVENQTNGVSIPCAFARKCPSAPHDLRWYFLFASRKLSEDPNDGEMKRWHQDPDNVRRNFTKAIKSAGIQRRMTAHDIRRASATHMHLDGVPLTKIQELLGHNSIEQTREYIMDDESNIDGSMSPFDRLMKGAG